jgi:hypothetical protein
MVVTTKQENKKMKIADHSLICRKKIKTEAYNDTAPGTTIMVKPTVSTYYEVELYSYIFGTLTVQVSKENYESIVVGSSYPMYIGYDK